MRDVPCPSTDPLTYAACVLMDDRLDHASVGHVGVPRAGERAHWGVTLFDIARWSGERVCERLHPESGLPCVLRDAPEYHGLGHCAVDDGFRVAWFTDLFDHFRWDRALTRMSALVGAR